MSSAAHQNSFKLLFTGVKTCSRCGLAKTKTHFHKMSASKDGLQPICKLCSAKSKRNNPDMKTRRRQLSPQQLKAITLFERGLFEDDIAIAVDLDYAEVRSWRYEDENYRRVLERALSDRGGQDREFVRRLCVICYKIKDKDKFYRARGNRGGRRRQCTRCVKADHRDHADFLSVQGVTTVVPNPDKVEEDYKGAQRLPYNKEGAAALESAVADTMQRFRGTARPERDVKKRRLSFMNPLRRFGRWLSSL